MYIVLVGNGCLSGGAFPVQQSYKWIINHAQAGCTQFQAQGDIVSAQAELFVKAPGLFESLPADRQAGAGDGQEIPVPLSPAKDTALVFGQPAEDMPGKAGQAQDYPGVLDTAVWTQQLAADRTHLGALRPHG